MNAGQAARWDRGFERFLFLIGVVGAALILVVLAVPVLLGRVYVLDDLPSFHLPWRALYAQSLSAGENFLWFPQLLGGYYAHGEGQAGMLHPFHLLLYRALPLHVAFGLELVTSYVVMLGGMFFFLRRWGQDRVPAVFGAIVFSFAGFNLMQFVHPNLVSVLAHTPWILLAIDVAMSSPDPRRVASARLAVGLLTASQLLLGHPHALWLSAALEALYVLERARDTIAPWPRLSGLLVAKILGVLAGGMQALPTWDAVSTSGRALAASQAGYFSLVPADLTQLVQPYLSRTRVFGGPFPHEFALYCGAAATASLLWVVVRRASLPPVSRRMAKAALALIVVATLLALGEYGYLYPLTLHLPLVGVFRSAARYVVLVQFALAVCGAIACADLIALSSGRTVCTRTQRLALVILPVCSALVVAAATWLRARPALAPEIASQVGPVGPALAGIALMATAALLFAAAASGRRAALPVLLLFAVLDQGYYGVSYLRSPIPPVPFDALVQGQAMPPDASAGRVQADNNILVLSGVRLAGGYAAFRPIGQLDELHPDRLRLAGVRWVLLGSSWAPQRAISPDRADWRGQLELGPATTDGMGRPSTWARVLRPMPRAWLVTNEVVSADAARDIASIDIETTALVTESHGLTSGIPGSAALLRDQPGRIELGIDAPSRQLLTVSERWHDGWHAVVDGRPEPVVRSYGDFIGAVVDQGSHTVEFYFWPASLRRGLWCSALGLALLISGYAVSRRPRTVKHP